MKRLNGMKKKNKWTLLIVGLVLCAVAGLTRTSQATAAEEELDLMSMNYLDPFDLTVTAVSAAPEKDTQLDMLVMSSTAEAASSPYAQPLKIWIPYRPTFRSPCTPSW